MGYMPVLQENGRWAIWNTKFNAFVAVNCHDIDVLSFLLKEAYYEARQQVKHFWINTLYLKKEEFNKKEWNLKESLSNETNGPESVMKVWNGLNSDYKVEEYVIHDR